MPPRMATVDALVAGRCVLKTCVRGCCVYTNLPSFGQVWNAADGTLVGVCRGHKRGVWSAAFSPVDLVVATSSGDKTIKIWSLGDFSCLKVGVLFQRGTECCCWQARRADALTALRLGFGCGPGRCRAAGLDF